MKSKIIAIITILLLSGCSYSELPPKTDDATTDYIVPQGVLPSEQERTYVNQAKEEYENATKY